MQVDVDAHAVLGGEREHGVDLPDRVAIDRRRVEAAEVVGAGAGRVGEQLEHAGAAQHAVLRERDDLDGERVAVVGDRLADDLDAAQAEPRVDVDVRADRGRAVAHELGEHALRDAEGRNAELVAAGALVADATLGAALAAVRLPGEPPPRLVDVRVRVDEPGEGVVIPPPGWCTRGRRGVIT